MIDKEKYKIVFDTNIIRQNKEDGNNVLFNNNLEDVFKFIKDNKIDDRVSMTITETVKEERIIQISEQILSYVNDAKKISNFIMDIGSKKRINISHSSIKRMAIKKFGNYLEKINIDILKNPQIDKTILERSLNRIKPFSNQGDKGFKDTLIWLSIIRDAKENKNTNYIFCSGNTNDFSDECFEREFKKNSKARFVYVSSISDLKEFLDKEVKLNLKLKELNEKIEQEIKQKIGDIMVNFNSYKSKLENNLSVVNPAFWTSAHLKLTSITSSETDTDIAGYNFRDISIKNVSKTNGDVYQISAMLTTEEVKNEKKGYGYVTPMSMSFFNKNIIYSEIVLTYNRSAGLINMISVYDTWSRIAPF